MASEMRFFKWPSPTSSAAGGSPYQNLGKGTAASWSVEWGVFFAVPSAVLAMPSSYLAGLQRCGDWELELGIGNDRLQVWECIWRDLLVVALRFLTDFSRLQGPGKAPCRKAGPLKAANLSWGSRGQWKAQDSQCGSPGPALRRAGHVIALSLSVHTGETESIGQTAAVIFLSKILWGIYFQISIQVRFSLFIICCFFVKAECHFIKNWLSWVPGWHSEFWQWLKARRSGSRFALTSPLFPRPRLFAFLTGAPHVAASGPLHSLFLLPGTLFSRTPRGSVFRFLLTSCFSETFLKLPCTK